MHKKIINLFKEACHFRQTNLSNSKKIFFLFIFLSISINLYSQQYFQKVTTGEIVNMISSNSQCAWGDYDNDGYQDLVVMPWNDNCWSCTYPIQMWHNNGDGTFTSVNNIITQNVINAIGCAWGDYDNDGRLDLIIVRPFPATNLLFHNEGNGSFTQVTTGPVVNDVGHCTAVSWVDYDRDGWLDLFICHDNNEPNFLYHNNGNGTFTRITTGNIVTDIGWSRSCAWGDYDNDGWPDLIVVNYNGLNPFMYHNNGNGTFTRVFNFVTNIQIWGSGCAWADYDNDGYLDLFIAGCNQKNWLIHNDGGGNFSNSYFLPSFDSGYSFTPSWGDYNNDGYLDLFITFKNSTNILYQNIGGQGFMKIFNEIPAMEGGNSEVGIWADYNNNGKLDLFVTNEFGSTPNYLYKNIGTSGNYLICKLRGCMPIPGNSNKDGIGARIKIKKGNFMEIREVTGGNSFGSENMLWQHFGLGTITTLDSVIVYWPSGKIQRLTNVNANQSITINECLIGIEKNQNQLPSKFELKQNYPNPFNPITAIEYSVQFPSNIKISVFDIEGRLINILTDKYHEAGNYKINFDGSNISSGVYLYKLESPEFTDMKKMILIK